MFLLHCCWPLKALGRQISTSLCTNALHYFSQHSYKIGKACRCSKPTQYKTGRSEDRQYKWFHRQFAQPLHASRNCAWIAQGKAKMVVIVTTVKTGHIPVSKVFQIWRTFPSVGLEVIFLNPQEGPLTILVQSIFQYLLKTHFRFQTIFFWTKILKSFLFISLGELGVWSGFFMVGNQLYTLA